VNGKETLWRYNEEFDPYAAKGAGFDFYGPAQKSLVAGNIRRIQKAHGKDAFAILSGASMTNEKSYLMGKFARVALGTANIDYNGRLCMVSAGAGNKMAFGIDRVANPWSDIPLAQCIIVTGSNIGECFPILTDYLWRARFAGWQVSA